MERSWSWQTVLLWAAAVVLVNVLWLNVAGQSAPNEINAEDQFQTYREVNISPVFGSSSPMPAAFETVFSSTSLDEGNVSYAIKLDNETTVHAWSGLLSDEAPVWTGELDPGTYTIETIVDEGIVVEQQLELKPLAAVQTVGHVVLTALLVLLAWGEQGYAHCWLAVRPLSQRSRKKRHLSSLQAIRTKRIRWLGTPRTLRGANLALITKVGQRKLLGSIVVEQRIGTGRQPLSVLSRVQIHAVVVHDEAHDFDVLSNRTLGNGKRQISVAQPSFCLCDTHASKTSPGLLFRLNATA